MDSSDIDARFTKAAEAIRKNEKKAKAAKQDDMLDIYGCYKIATTGKVNIPRPTGIFNAKEKYKWDAWNKWSEVEDLVNDQDKAKEKYCELVNNIVAEEEW